MSVCVLTLSRSNFLFWWFLQSSRVLTEHDMNDLCLHSPDQVGSKAEGASDSSARTSRNPPSQNLAAASDQGISNNSSSGNPCVPVSSPTVSGKKHKSHSVAVTCVQSTCSSAALEIRGHSSQNDASIQTISM